jgi:thioredoxin-dependent peroxiredoxin
VKAGAEVIGISAGTPAVRTEMIAKHRIPFTLLQDGDGTARAAFGVGKFLGLDQRITFVVDRSGLVRHVCDSQLRVGKHISEAVAMVKELA